MLAGLLVFAGKRVGTEIVRSLLAQAAPVERLVIANSEDVELGELARAYNVEHEVYDSRTQERLFASGASYAWLLNLWSPKILRGPTLALAERRLNIHPSLVPHCRGSDSAAWSLREACPAGVSLIEMVEGVDQGDVYAQREVAAPFPTRGRDLHEALQAEAIALFNECWPRIAAGRLEPKPQADGGSYHTRRQTNADRILDCKETVSVEEFVRWALAHDFQPGTTAEIRHGNDTYEITLSLSVKS